MFKGSVYSYRWTYTPKGPDGKPAPGVKPKKRKAWGIRYRIDDGPLIRKIVADTKDGANTELDRVREKYRKAQLGVSEGKTFADLVKPFLEFKEQRGRSMEAIQSRVHNLTPHFGAKLLSQIDAEAIDGYVTARRAEYLKKPCKKHKAVERCAKCDERINPATINRDLAVLRHMLRLAMRKWRWLEREPYIEMLPENAPRDLELTEAEEARILAECSPALADLLAGALATGMRQGELLTLTWPQVNLAERVIDFAPTKRGRKRLMPINETLYYVLARRKAAAQGKARPAKPDRVFSRPDGVPWSKWSVEDQFGKALAAAGIKKALVFHDLRHTFASRLKRNGVGETEIQRLLGHKSLQMTDRYITVEVEQMRVAVASLASKNNAKQTAPVPAVAGNIAE
jgi:integrase